MCFCDVGGLRTYCISRLAVRVSSSEGARCWRVRLVKPPFTRAARGWWWRTGGNSRTLSYEQHGTSLGAPSRALRTC
eukprot:6057094-Prymnesium_polylepis.1